MTKRVVLAYSGGLDTSVAVRWMIQEWGVEVVCCLVNVGQDVESSESFDDIRARALAAGALEFVVVDARAEMAEEFCAGHHRERPLRGEVPAGVGPVAPGHRAPPGGPGEKVQRAPPSPTAAPARATIRCASRWARTPWPRISKSTRPARNWGLTRADCVELRRQVGDSHHGHQGQALLDRREPVGQGHRVRGHRRPLGRGAR
jgi:hypothetical protein